MSSLQTITTKYCSRLPSGSLAATDFTARLALDDQTKTDAYAIRHASYLSGGYIDAQPDRLFSDADDLKPNSTSLVVYKKGQPVASVRLCELDLNLWPDRLGRDPSFADFPRSVGRAGRQYAPWSAGQNHGN